MSNNTSSTVPMKAQKDIQWMATIPQLPALEGTNLGVIVAAACPSNE